MLKTIYQFCSLWI